MRKILVAALALLASISGLSAQNAAVAQPSTTANQPAVQAERPAKDPTTRANHMANRLSKAFNLAPGQREQVFTIFLNQFQQVDQLRGQQAVRDKVHAIRAKTDADLKALLGEENYAKYQQMREEKKEHHRQKMNR